MSVFSRLTDVINANLHSLLDKSEEPEKMLRLMIEEMEQVQVEMRTQAARVIAEQKQLERHQQALQAQILEWSAKAELAIQKGREDLARQALLAREECRQAIAQLNADIKGADANLAEIDAAVRELEAKREETRLQAKAQMAADHTANGTSGAGGGGSRAEAHLNRIATLEQRAQFATEDEIPARSSASVTE